MTNNTILLLSIVDRVISNRIEKYLNFIHWRLLFTHFLPLNTIYKIYLHFYKNNIFRFTQSAFVIELVIHSLRVKSPRLSAILTCNIRVQLHHAEINSTQLLTFAICGLGYHQYWSFIHEQYHSQNRSSNGHNSIG